MTTELSPLAAVDIEAIFAPTTDPRTLTDADRLRLVQELRRRRASWLSEEAAKAAKGKTPRAKPDIPSAETAAKTNVPATEIDLFS